MLPGEVIAIFTTLSWSVGIFPFTEASKRFGSQALNQYRLLLAWLIITLILLNYYSINLAALFQTPEYSNYLFLGLSGIIGFTIGDYFSFSSFTILGPKLGSLYFTFAPGAALVAGYFILGERINFIGVIGIITTIGGVIWLTLSKQDKVVSENAGFSRSVKGALFGVMGALCQGIGLVLSKLGMNVTTGSPIVTMHAVWIRLLFAFAAAFILSFLAGRFLKNSAIVFKNANNGLPYLFVGTFFGPVCGVTLSLLAIQKMQVAAAQTIFALLPIFVLPLNYFYYKEKITIQAVLACLVAIVGVVTLIWRNEILLWI